MKPPGPWSAWSRTRAGCRRRSGSATAPSSVAFGEGAVWVANRIDGTVSRIDPETERGHQHGRGRRRPRARSRSERVRSGWRTPATARCRDSRRIRRRSRRRSRSAAAPAASRSRGGAVWTSVLASTESHRGGTLSAAMSAGDLYCDCVDPASYDFGNTDRGLARIRRADRLQACGRRGGLDAGRQPRHRVPEPEDDGLTYVFELRPDLRFSDGTEVDPEDFRSSIERMLRSTRGCPSAPPTSSRA